MKKKNDRKTSVKLFFVKEMIVLRKMYDNQCVWLVNVIKMLK